VIQFMCSDDSPVSKGNLMKLPGLYEIVGSRLAIVDEARLQTLRDAYVAKVLINRSGTPENILRGGAEPDPLAEWFPYADNVNDLVARNTCASPHLVIRCISENLAYTTTVSTKKDGTMAPSAEEPRHLVALNIADGKEDLIDDNEPSRLTGYAMKAIDLGHLCPPRCK